MYLLVVRKPISVLCRFYAEDTPCVSASAAAGTIHRLRRAGETRKLFVMNFRVVPLHVVVVWALPARPKDGAGHELLQRPGRAQKTAERLAARGAKRPMRSLAEKGDGSSMHKCGLVAPRQCFLDASFVDLSFGASRSIFVRFFP